MLRQEVTVADRISYFNCVCRLNYPHDRLASTLFLSVPLCSEKGRNAVHNMIALYRDTPRVAYCPSLRPRNSFCPIEECNQDMKECVLERDTLDKTELANSFDNRIEAAKR
jgi:hypothetical protein